MMPGSDLSALTSTAASAAAKGLSIVVPVYNEAAGLAVLHQRICDIAKTLRISDIMLTISHCRAYATACALAVRGNG